MLIAIAIDNVLAKTDTVRTCTWWLCETSGFRYSYHYAFLCFCDLPFDIKRYSWYYYMLIRLHNIKNLTKKRDVRSILMRECGNVKCTSGLGEKWKVHVLQNRGVSHDCWVARHGFWPWNKIQAVPPLVGTA